MSNLLAKKPIKDTVVKVQPSKVNTDSKVFELSDIKLSNGLPIKYEASLNPIEGQIKINISDNIKSTDKNNL